MPGVIEPASPPVMKNITSFVNFLGPGNDYPLRPLWMKDMSIIVAPDGTDCYTNSGAAQSLSLALLVAAFVLAWTSLQ